MTDESKQRLEQTLQQIPPKVSKDLVRGCVGKQVVMEIGNVRHNLSSGFFINLLPETSDIKMREQLNDIAITELYGDKPENSRYQPTTNGKPHYLIHRTLNSRPLLQ